METRKREVQPYQACNVWEWVGLSQTAKWAGDTQQPRKKNDPGGLGGRRSVAPVLAHTTFSFWLCHEPGAKKASSAGGWHDAGCCCLVIRRELTPPSRRRRSPPPSSLPLRLTVRHLEPRVARSGRGRSAAIRDSRAPRNARAYQHSRGKCRRTLLGSKENFAPFLTRALFVVSSGLRSSHARRTGGREEEKTTSGLNGCRPSPASSPALSPRRETAMRGS